MGLFSQPAEANPYEKIKPHLATIDGNLHVVMACSYSTWTTTKFHCDESYTSEIDAVLQGMQADGYEIVSVQHVPMANGTGFGAVTTTTLITYR